MVLADCKKCQVYLPKDKRVIEGRVELLTASGGWWIWTAN